MSTGGTNVVSFQDDVAEDAGPREQTPLEKEIDRAMKSPAARLALMRDGARDAARAAIDLARHDIAVLEGWLSTGKKSVHESYTDREASRQRQVENLQAQILDLNRTSERDADDMRARCRDLDAEYAKQTAALQSIIKVQEAIIAAAAL